MGGLRERKRALREAIHHRGHRGHRDKKHGSVVADPERWEDLWRALEAHTPDVRLGESLLRRYDEPQRKYHTVRHLDECLAHFDAYRALAQNPAALEAALWFHDAVYEPLRQDNEARSAELATRVLSHAGVPAATSARVAALIMATRHEAHELTGDTTLIADIDLAILGAPPARYREYAAQVRQEYAVVPTSVYRRRRRALLHSFLRRPAIFHTLPIRDRFDWQARANLRDEIEQLT